MLEMKLRKIINFERNFSMLEMKLRKNYSVTSFAEKEIRKLCNSLILK